jgi:hypothetical protein
MLGVNVGIAMCKTTAEFSSVIRILKTDLFNFIKENFCSQLYVDAKIVNILPPMSLNLLYLGSRNSPKEPAHVAELNFSFSPLSLCNSISSS